MIASRDERSQCSPAIGIRLRRNARAGPHRARAFALSPDGASISTFAAGRAAAIPPPVKRRAGLSICVNDVLLPPGTIYSSAVRSRGPGASQQRLDAARAACQALALLLGCDPFAGHGRIEARRVCRDDRGLQPSAALPDVNGTKRGCPGARSTDSFAAVKRCVKIRPMSSVSHDDDEDGRTGNA